MLRLLLCAFALSSSLLPATTWANPTRIEAVEAELIVDSTTIKAGEPFWAALVLRLDPHWHTYWKNPGDSGYAAQIDWQLPDGFSADSFLWPAPERIPTPPLMSYAYENEVILPVQITPPAVLPLDGTYKIGGEAHWLMCKDICLPGDTPLFVEVQTGVNRVPHPVFDSVIQTVRARIPSDHLQLESTASYGENALTLTLKTPQDEPFPEGAYVFIPEEEGVIQDSAPQTSSISGNTLTLTVPRDMFNAHEPAPLTGLIKSDSGLITVPITAQVATTASADAASTPAATPTTFFFALMLAFVGGLILNLMPCVLPVLSIKVLHVIQHAKKHAAWKHGVAFTLGVVATFLLLVVVLETLKAGGSHIGWGFQLQSPAFVTVLSVVLTIIALDLFGVFEIGLSLTRLGNAFDDRKGHLGSFSTGILATVVATPCTAPFMGSAIAYALGQDMLTTAAIFTALGLGLSTPYLLLTIFPRLLHFVPKAGAWMETAKQLLAFPVLATVVWLAWVLSLQAGATALAVLLFTLLIISFLGWLYGKAQHSGASFIWVGIILLLGLCITVLSAHRIEQMEAVSTPTALEQQENWKPYTKERLAKYTQMRRPVLVVYTAAWCLTCKVNEQLVLRAPETLKLFADYGVEVLIADWTKRDATIADDLAKFGRNGVPFYLYYPAEGGVKPLPELLTYTVLKQAIATPAP